MSLINWAPEMDDYEKYENDCKEIRRNNKQLLGEFERSSKSSGLSENTINNHVSNIDFYVNEYLLVACRVSARDTCRGLLPPTGLAQWRQPCCAPVRPASVRFATPSQARCWLRRTPTNGLTACRMRLHMPYVGFGTYRPRRQLRPYARAYAYRGLRAFASLSLARSVGTCTTMVSMFLFYA